MTYFGEPFEPLLDNLAQRKLRVFAEHLSGARSAGSLTIYVSHLDACDRIAGRVGSTWSSSVDAGADMKSKKLLSVVCAMSCEMIRV